MAADASDVPAAPKPAEDKSAEDVLNEMQESQAALGRRQIIADYLHQLTLSDEVVPNKAEVRELLLAAMDELGAFNCVHSQERVLVVTGVLREAGNMPWFEDRISTSGGPRAGAESEERNELFSIVFVSVVKERFDAQLLGLTASLRGRDGSVLRACV